MGKDFPLISINIPSYNSEKTLPLTLESIKKQRYPNVEVLVIDSFSKDRTRDIARNYGARVIDCEGKLLMARYLGVRESRGEYILLLDTDQILKEDTLERALPLMEKYDMLVLEEESYNREWLIPRLYAASKIIISKRFDKDYAFDPVKGGNPPRLFKKEIIEKAFENIPKELIRNTIHYDHDIIYYECYKISERVGILRGAVYHIEPDFKKLWKTNIRYGASLREVKKTPYWELFLKKRGCGFWFGRPVKEGILAFILSLILKTVQLIGYHLLKKS